MKTRPTAIADKATTLIESHSWLALLLAVLCLVFATNYAFIGPGSDGGSGLGGTGRTGGESGLGGTGKTPDSGPTFKLGANDRDHDFGNDPERGSAGNAGDEENGPAVYYVARHVPEPTVEFNVAGLRLSLEAPQSPAVLTPAVGMTTDQAPDLSALVSAIDLADNLPEMSIALQNEKDRIFADALVSSDQILHGLMLAESETSVQLADSARHEETDSAIRNRIAMPVRPERPDRLSIPTRVTSVPRTAIPAPPPVRPMRTLSSLLNR